MENIFTLKSCKVELHQEVPTEIIVGGAKIIVYHLKITQLLPGTFSLPPKQRRKK